MGLAQQCARPMVVHNKIIEKELEAVEGTQYVTKESILRRAQEIKGIPLRDVDKTGRLTTGKGAIGTVIEESWFGYTPNSESEPDFPEAGVELKVTPYLRGKNGIRAKERLVCNIINYMEEYDKTFQTSAFWHKCNTMLLMSYEHLADKPKGDFRIDEAVLFSFPDEDLAIIEHDWKTIMEKVRAGRAHELSEGDTLYLAACTKGANASSVRQQPFSELPAKQRAYSLKSSYMTQILNKYIFGNAESPRIIKSADVLHAKTFEDYIIDKVKHLTFVNSLPSLSQKYKDISILNNRSSIKGKKYDSILYAPADNPFEVYNFLEKKYADEPSICISPLATKPVALGVCMFALNYEKVRIVYPISDVYSSHVTNQVTKILVYEISLT